MESLAYLLAPLLSHADLAGAATIACYDSPDLGSKPHIFVSTGPENPGIRNLGATSDVARVVNCWRRTLSAKMGVTITNILVDVTKLGDADATPISVRPLSEMIENVLDEYFIENPEKFLKYTPEVVLRLRTETMTADGADSGWWFPDEAVELATRTASCWLLTHLNLLKGVNTLMVRHVLPPLTSHKSLAAKKRIYERKEAAPKSEE